MKNKILLLSLVVLGIVMCIGLASAYVPYGYYSNYNYQPVRVGGFFGQNSAYIIGLRPGTYYDTSCMQGTPSMFYQPCSARYARAGGWFGYAPYNNYYYYGLRTYGYGNYGYGGTGTDYANVPYMYHGPL